MARPPITNTDINGTKYFKTTVTLGYDSNGKQIQKLFYGKSKGEAEQKKQDYIFLTESGINPDLGSLPLEKAMSDWLWNIEKFSGNKTSTFERYEIIHRKHIEGSMIGKIKVYDINKLVVQKYYNKLVNEGRSFAFIKFLHKLLNKFFRYAMSEGYVTRNPIYGMKLPKSHEEDINEDDRNIETFSDEELNKIVSSLGNVKLKYVVLFAVLTGARQGEILALKKSDVQDGIVRINKTIRNVKVFEDKKNFTHELKVTRPKSSSSVREIPIPDKLSTELKSLDILVKQEKLRMGPAYTNNDLLFPSITGTYLNEQNLRRSWQRALERLGMPYKKFHSLRHTYATRMIENGVELLTVSRLLGHNSITTTEIYAHTLKDTKVEAVKTFDTLFK